MALKSYRLRDTLKRKPKKSKSRRRLSDTGRILIGGTTALIGVGLLSATAEAVSRV